MYSSGPPYMNEQRQDDQLESTYSSSVSIWDVAVKTCRKQWTIGRGSERESGISVLIVQQDDDDDDDDIGEKEMPSLVKILITKMILLWVID